MAHFYLVDDAVPAEGGLALLVGAEAKHAATVSRTRIGERLLIGDGRGAVGSGIVRSAEAHEVVVEVDSVTLHEAPSRRITLVQALAKGDRDELAIQAATELGVDRIIPWQAERSVSRWDGAKSARGVERWRSIVREAAKQSIRPWIPEVGDAARTGELTALAADASILVLQPEGAARLSDAVAQSSGDLVLVVGPEGGISPGELSRFEDAGALAVRLGPEVLRTSTAGPAALAAISALTGRWS